MTDPTPEEMGVSIAVDAERIYSTGSGIEPEGYDAALAEYSTDQIRAAVSAKDEEITRLHDEFTRERKDAERLRVAAAAVEREIIDAARALDEWIGSKAIRRMTSDPKSAADFGVLVVALRAAIRARGEDAG